MLTDKDGKLAERYSYSVTGEVTIYDASGTELENSALGNRWMYTGREWLPEIGLYDYRNRVYSAQLGRFLQTDPTGFNAEDLNLYRYVQNDYSNYVDPHGEAWLREKNQKYVVGRDDTIVPPGGVVGRFLEDKVPAMHTFGVLHDYFVGYMTEKKNMPDFVVNFPSMPIIYGVAFFYELSNSVGDLINYMME